MIIVYFLFFALCGVVAGNYSSNTNSSSVLVQLNVTSFAYCLGQVGAPNWTFERSHYHLSFFDSLLLYLSLYSGDRFRVLNSTQQRAYEEWQVNFLPQGRMLAFGMLNLANNNSVAIITPGMVFNMAVESCGSGSSASQPDYFCAFLICHNVLRTLGRHKTAIGPHGVNYNPPWFQEHKSVFVAAAKTLNTKLIPLTRVPGPELTERFGAWYHTFGLFTFAANYAAVVGDRLSEQLGKFVVFMDTLLNPIIAHAKEDPLKAQIDKDAIKVAYTLFTGKGSPSAFCRARRGYVNFE